MTEPLFSTTSREDTVPNEDAAIQEEDTVSNQDAAANEEGTVPSKGYSADEEKFAEGSASDDDVQADWFDAVPNLRVLGDRLSSLDMTCHQSISDLLNTISRELPRLQHLVLRLCFDTFEPDFLPVGFGTNPECREEIKTRNNCLRSLVLSVHSAGVHVFHIPFVLEGRP